MNPIILTAIIASGVVFLFVLAGKLAWFLRKMEEDPDAVSGGGPGGNVEARSGQTEELAAREKGVSAD